MIKKVFRMVIFSSLAIYLTALWNKGFIFPEDLGNFFTASLLIAFIYYLVKPIMKVILLPLNILTLGLVSSIAYFIVFYFFIKKTGLLLIKPWEFPGANLFGITLNKMSLSFVSNIIVSSLSVSTIINLLEKFL